MLNSWVQDAALKTLLVSWSNLIGVDLLRLGTTADSDEIKDTANAQPLIVATSLLGLHALGSIKCSVTTGHSVGEITAAAISGAISEADALTLVRARGIEMAKAAKTGSTGMSAILGGDRSEVLSLLALLNLVPANDNGAGQIVAAGELVALAQLAETPPTGARIRALAVAGAFHTAYMQPAAAPFNALAATLSTMPVLIPFISNGNGAVVTDGQKVLAGIVNQISNQVRWDLCMESLKAQGVTGLIELPPAGSLVGLIKRAASEIETFALKSPNDLIAANEFAERHK